MSVEAKEFVRWREDVYAAERSRCPAPVEMPPDREIEVGSGRSWRCLCCGEVKPIPAMQHVCRECQVGSADSQ